MDSPETKAIAVIGAGSWGTTLAQLLAEKGLDVRLWVREPEVYADLLPGPDQPHLFARSAALLPPHLHPGIPAALDGAGVVLMVVPSHGFRQVLRDLKPHCPPEAMLLSATKGMEIDSLPHHGGGGPGGNGRGSPLCGAGRPQLRPGSGPEATHRGDHRLPAAGDRPLTPAASFPPPTSGSTPPTMSPAWSWGGP